MAPEDEDRLLHAALLAELEGKGGTIWGGVWSFGHYLHCATFPNCACLPLAVHCDMCLWNGSLICYRRFTNTFPQVCPSCYECVRAAGLFIADLDKSHSAWATIWTYVIEPYLWTSVPIASLILD